MQNVCNSFYQCETRKQIGLWEEEPKEGFKFIRKEAERV